MTMKRLCALFFAVSFAVVAWGQEPEDTESPGWVNSSSPEIPAFSVEDTPFGLEAGCVGGYSGSATAIAEVITPEIEALARGLGHDPLRIYKYVHDHIRQVFYFGSKKGAHLTLLERSGNDFDQSALLVALLRASGYSASSQFGFVTLPWSSADHRDIPHWLQLNVNTNTIGVSNYLYQLTGVRGFPMFINSRSNTNIYTIHRVWVKFALGGTNYYLDPGFKISERISGIDLAAAMGMDTNALLSIAGGTNGTHSIQSLNEPAVRNKLRDYTTNLLSYLQSNHPNASVEEIAGGWRIVPSTNTALSLVQPFTVYTYGGKDCVMDWENQPTNFMVRLSMTLGGTNFSLPTPLLQGQRLSLDFSNGVGRLWQDEALLVQRATTGSAAKTNVVFRIHQPFGIWNLESNLFTDYGWYSDSTTNAYQRTQATYAILCGFDVNSERLKSRQNKLEFHQHQGAAGTNWALAEALNVMGISWMEQTELVAKLLARQTDVLHMYHHRLGRMAQETGNGYYIDFPVDRRSHAPMGGWSSAHWLQTGRMADIGAYFMSGLEHGIIEQFQNTNLTAASSISVLQKANTNNTVIYLAKSSNWSSIRDNQLFNYTSADKTRLNKYISAGYEMLIPKNGAVSVSGNGGWSGWGIIARLAAPNHLVAAFRMDISGVYQGGAASDPDTELDSTYIVSVSYDQPTFSAPQGPFLPSSYGADPVRMSDGAFELEFTDLFLGQSEPRGIAFTHEYSSLRRFQNTAGMAPGWTHNYFFRLAEVSAPEAGLGLTTPAQMASMLVATRSAFELYQTNSDPKNWLLTALIAKWGVDQLIKKAVSATLGDDTVQFVTQPDGSFTPPANCTMSLAKSDSTYNLSERHGRTFKFDSDGRLTNILDQYGQGMNLTYNASNWVTKVTDWKGRYLELNYSGIPLRLTSVTDSTGRSLFYGYTTNFSPAGDLVFASDPESKTNTFLYDIAHQIITTRNALGQIVVSNAYDLFGRVTNQYSQGIATQQWSFFWSGFVNTEQDPAGGKRIFFYDGQSREIGQQNALGQTSWTEYDGQSHVVRTVSPLNEVTEFQFDGRHNLVRVIDPLNFTNSFTFDSQDRLTSSVDARGNSSRFGYNSKFQITGSTNGAGDWQTFVFNATDGTLTTRTDAGGTTTHAYDSWGQLSSVVHPGGLGTELFLNNALGDVLTRTNARGFITTLQYNARRELTNTVAPTNLAARVVYDAMGNVQTATDARGFATTHFWSATRKPLGSVFPSTPQGSPSTTNVYDSRDWLAQLANPLQQVVRLTNDAAGRLISSTDPLLRTARLAYDANGRRTHTTNAALEVTTQRWTVRGEAASLTDGATNTSVRGYDAAGNNVILTNRNGKLWQFQFDGANRLTNTITPLNRSTLVTYDERGLVKTVREPSGDTVTNQCDARGRLTNRADSVSALRSLYDSNNNRTAVFESGHSNVWTFDAYDRVTSYRDADGNVMQYHRDQNGNVTNLVYPGGQTVSYAFDSLNRVTNVTDWANRKTSLEYDLASRLRKITRPNGTVRTMDYDAAGQLTNLWEKTASGTPIAVFKLGWNNAGRVEREFAAPLPHAWTPPVRTMTYDDDNRLATFNSQSITHDSDGNMTSGPLTNSVLTNYVFDARNRLLSAGGMSYAYDPLNQRTTLTNGTNITRFVVNPSAALSQVLLRVKNGVTNYYVYGAGLLYEADDAGTTRTYHFDYRGSTVALTDGSGDVSDRAEYSAYGTLMYRTGTTDTPFLYNGRYGVQTDANGLLHMRARFYNPHLGRFLNADPSGFSGGMNFYAYADGNPISYLDPFGLSAWTSAMGGLKAIGGGLETVIGYGFAVFTAETVVGAAAGIAVGTHGVDTFQSGIRQMWTGQATDSFTSQGMQAAGVPQPYANLADAGISIVGTAGLSTLSSASAAGPLVHLTDSAGGAGINFGANAGNVIGSGGIYAGPLANASANGLGVTARTFMLPGSYQAAVRIPAAAEGAFSGVLPIGPISGLQSYFGQAYTAAGSLNLASGIFTRTGPNIGQALFYGVDATLVNGGSWIGTALSTSGTGK